MNAKLSRGFRKRLALCGWVCFVILTVPLPSQAGSGDIRALAIDPGNPATIYAGTYGGGVFKSTNGAGYWSAVNTGLTNLNVQALAINPANPSTVYAGTRGGGGVFKSIVILTERNSAKAYPDPLRRVSYFDAETQKRLKFLTTNFVLPALPDSSGHTHVLPLLRTFGGPSISIRRARPPAAARRSRFKLENASAIP